MSQMSDGARDDFDVLDPLADDRSGGRDRRGRSSPVITDDSYDDVYADERLSEDDDPFFTATPAEDDPAPAERGRRRRQSRREARAEAASDRVAARAAPAASGRGVWWWAIFAMVVWVAAVLAFSAGLMRLPVTNVGVFFGSLTRLDPQSQLLVAAVALAPLGLVMQSAATARRAAALTAETRRIEAMVAPGRAGPPAPISADVGASVAAQEGALRELEQTLLDAGDRADRARERLAAEREALTDLLQRLEDAPSVAARAAPPLASVPEPAAPPRAAPAAPEPGEEAAPARRPARAAGPSASSPAVLRAAEAARQSISGDEFDSGDDDAPAESPSQRLNKIRDKLRGSDGGGGRRSGPTVAAPAGFGDDAPFEDDDAPGFEAPSLEDAPRYAGERAFGRDQFDQDEFEQDEFDQGEFDQGSLDQGAYREGGYAAPPAAAPGAGAAGALDWRKLVRAANFPDSEEDQETLEALYAVLTDKEAAELLQTAEDALSALADIGLFMEDMQPDHAPADRWRSFIVDRSMAGAMELGGVRDATAIEDVATALADKPDFEDVARRFVESYERILGRLFAEAGDAGLSIELANTRTGRAYMLVGRASGRFG